MRWPIFPAARNTITILLVVLGFGGTLAAEEKPAFEPLKKYQVHPIEGWTVLVHPDLAQGQPKVVKATLKELGHQLYKITRMIPPEPLEQIKQVKIVIENFDVLHPCMCYHPDPGWLKGKNVNPDKARCVEIANPKNFLEWCRHTQPWMVLHELAHAYHHQFLPDGYGNKEVAAAHVRAREEKLYAEVLHVNGRKTKHYALTNPMEYFAEASEAYFGTNDFYPYVRSELRQFDRTGFELMEKMWKVKK